MDKEDTVLIAMCAFAFGAMMMLIVLAFMGDDITQTDVDEAVCEVTYEVEHCAFIEDEWYPVDIPKDE